MYLIVSEETGDYYLLLYTTLYFVIVLRVHITPFKHKAQSVMWTVLCILFTIYV